MSASTSVQYYQFDAFHLDERETGPEVTYTDAGGSRVTVPLVNKYAVIVVDAFSKMTWTCVLVSPQGAGIAPMHLRGHRDALLFDREFRVSLRKSLILGGGQLSP